MHNVTVSLSILESLYQMGHNWRPHYDESILDLYADRYLLLIEMPKIESNQLAAKV